MRGKKRRNGAVRRESAATLAVKEVVLQEVSSRGGGSEFGPGRTGRVEGAAPPGGGGRGRQTTD